MTDTHESAEAEAAEDTHETSTPELSDSESGNPEGSDPESDPDTFTRDYVEGLRQENGKYRQRAQRADELAHRLHTELVRATGKLADPTDLEFDEDHIADAAKMIAAIDDLLTRKPHLASRRPAGDIGQGPSPSAGTVDLAAILRGKAG
ncbi:hypothetical protein [Mycolicibacterium austroafricanum]|uniref:hypothetical protein n=1 Tax=Mycolicibacterium austroafricanum TaxID=39687 RepID=UPI001CA34AA4|nr:hypothetical protein [Mycolicibacterium austroafricanum]QZT54605.1 hypothetical protein JN084_16265 [Mycolicibacterium austroafricanum]